MENRACWRMRGFMKNYRGKMLSEGGAPVKPPGGHPRRRGLAPPSFDERVRTEADGRWNREASLPGDSKVEGEGDPVVVLDRNVLRQRPRQDPLHLLRRDAPA